MKPLTIEELKELEVGDWVWIVCCLGGNYAKKLEQSANSLKYKTHIAESYLNYIDYGKNWLAYKNKEQAEGKEMQAVKEFAEKFREQLEQYRLDNEYFTADEPNGNLWQMNSSVFYLEVIDKGGLIDELVKGYTNG